MMTPYELRRKIASLFGPFGLYLVVAVALNLYPFAATIRAANEYNGDVGECRRAVSWLYTNAGLCVLHIAAAIYIATVGRTMVQSWEKDMAATTTAQKNESGKAAAATPTAQQTAYISVEDPTGSATEEDLKDSTSAPTTVDVLKNFASRITLKMYMTVFVFYLCWTTVGLKRHMMNAGYCGGNIRMHVADSVLCAVLFMILCQGILVFGAWRTQRVISQGRVSGLDRPAYGIET